MAPGVFARIQRTTFQQGLCEDTGPLHIGQRRLTLRIGLGLHLLLKVGQGHDGQGQGAEPCGFRCGFRCGGHTAGRVVVCRGHRVRPVGLGYQARRKPDTA